MIDIVILLEILTLHFIGDFVLQSHWMASNKANKNTALLAHISVYTVVLLIINPMWALINGLLHLMVDYVTSRVAGKLWKSGDIHNFFVVIGFDQLLHIITLVITYSLLQN